jgi:hypothetical protein
VDDRASVIASVISGGGHGFVERAIFGTSDPEAIVAAVDAFCRTHLGAGVARYDFYAASVGSVHGVRLRDGRQVVVKAHQPGWTAGSLGAMCRVQAHLRGRAFPCPEPLIEPAPIGLGLATADEFLARGSRWDGHDPSFRRAIAQMLARLVRLCSPIVRGVGELRTDRLLNLPTDRLWPQPHSRLFDFDATIAGADDIDDLAEAARARLDAVDRSAPVVGHTDWRAEHLRYDGSAIVAAFDWDSVALTTEPVLVGATAHAFTADWSIDVERPRAPALDEARSFVREYERSRARAFDPAEREDLSAAYALATAYTARCAHAIDPDGATEQAGGFRTLVREHGRRLMELYP